MNIYRYINIRYIIVYVYITIFLERRFFFSEKGGHFFFSLSALEPNGRRNLRNWTWRRQNWRRNSRRGGFPGVYLQRCHEKWLEIWGNFGKTKGFTKWGSSVGRDLPIIAILVGRVMIQGFFRPLLQTTHVGWKHQEIVNSFHFPLPQKRWSIQADNGVRIKIQLESPIMALTPSPHQDIVFVP